MPRYEIDSKITILKKELTVGSFLPALMNLPATDVVQFFNEVGLTFPRELRINVLREVLRGPVMGVREERATLADEMNYRLSWFNQYSEVQLNNLFKFFKDAELEKKYLEQLWLAIIEYITDKKIAEKDFDSLITKAETHAKKEGLTTPDIVKYNNELNPLFFDQKGKIDGLTQEVIRPVLYKSSTISEIRELGKKYNVDVPKRLRKQELIDIILKELKDRGEYTEEVEAELNAMNILVIQRFAINKNIKASTELKKEEVIEYILANAKETKEAYFVPSSSVYELEAKDVGEPMPEVVVTEEVKQEVEEVKEETVEEVKETVVETEKVIIKEPVISEELLQRLTVKEEKVGLNVDEIEETHLNVLQYYGQKPKKHAKVLNDEATEIINSEISQDDVYQVELVGARSSTEKQNSAGKVFLKVLMWILIILISIAIIVLLYVGFTPNGPAKGLEKVEDFINNIFNLNSISWLREKLHNLLGTK